MQSNQPAPDLSLESMPVAKILVSMALNSAPDFKSSLAYQPLVDLIAEEGVSAFVRADIAAGLFNYLRVMEAHYDTYICPEPVDEFCVM
jgi:hypothetical protein